MTPQEIKNQRWNICKAHQLNEMRYPCICSRTALDIAFAKYHEKYRKEFMEGLFNTQPLFYRFNAREPHDTSRP